MQFFWIFPRRQVMHLALDVFHEVHVCILLIYCRKIEGQARDALPKLRTIMSLYIYTPIF